MDPGKVVAALKSCVVHAPACSPKYFFFCFKFKGKYSTQISKYGEEASEGSNVWRGTCPFKI